MIIAPLHVKSYCIDDSDDIDLHKIKGEYSNPNTHPYKLQCSCGSQDFYCFTNEHPDFICNCANCGKKIVVYDLHEYPAAIKTDTVFEIKQINNEPTSVYPVYEYGDDFWDAGADENDITWFSVYIVIKGLLTLVLDDETA